MHAHSVFSQVYSDEKDCKALRRKNILDCTAYSQRHTLTVKCNHLKISANTTHRVKCYKLNVEMRQCSALQLNYKHRLLN